MDSNDSSVAGLAVFGIFVLPVLAFIVMRVLAHRERIEMIRRGLTPPRGWGAKAWTNINAGAPFDTQPMPPGPPMYAQRSNDDSPERSLRKGIMLALIGLAIFIGLSFIGFQQDGPFTSYRPGPWLLGGLIPMFVGIAQIIVALLSGARLGAPPLGNVPPSYAPPPQPGRGPGPDVTTYGPEPRTHSGYEELKRPVPPPDRR